MIALSDSKIDPRWVEENMRLNPPRRLESGVIFSGPVRLSFPNVFRPGKPSQEGAEGKYGAALLFPPGTAMDVFSAAWHEAARAAFPKNFDASGHPSGLHSPFHDQREKAVGAKPLAGYTPGAIFLNVSSKFKPTVVDPSQNLIVDEDRVYPGVWAFAGLNVYTYNDPRKKGVGFGLQTLMIIADDVRLAGGGGDPRKDFEGIKLTAQSNVAAQFDAAPRVAQPRTDPIMPSGGHVGAPGPLPISSVSDDEMRALGL